MQRCQALFRKKHSQKIKIVLAVGRFSRYTLGMRTKFYKIENGARYVHFATSRFGVMLTSRSNLSKELMIEKITRQEAANMLRFARAKMATITIR
jgi:hypothetical protein